MAPQTIAIGEVAPNTLPADFAEWDGGGPPPAPPATLPTTLPDDFFDEIDAAAASPAKVAKAQAALAPAPAKAQAPAPAKVSGKTATSKAKAASAEAVAVPAPSRPQPSSAEPAAKSKDKKKSPVKGIAIGASLLVLASAGILIPLKLLKPAAGKVVVKQTVTEPPPVTLPQALSSSAPSIPTLSTPQDQQQSTVAQTTQQPHSVDSAKMVNQLVAPSRIANNINGAGKDSGPVESFSANGMEGLGGASGTAVGSALNGASHPKVKLDAPKNVSISSGVASGLLLQKRDPVYPALAKQSNVSGTVVLEATISKSGAIQNLHVLSGPVMLRQAALDAVGMWRYKPYLLDNQPVDVQTTISLTFSLGR
jgi:protein TonB